MTIIQPELKALSFFVVTGSAEDKSAAVRTAPNHPAAGRGSHRNSRGDSFSSTASHPPQSHADRKQEEQKATQNPNGQSNANNNGSMNRQTVRNVKARDKYKKDYGGYPSAPPQTTLPLESKAPNDLQGYNNFRDANSMLSYKSRNPTQANVAGSRCSSEFTDATSTTSATSGSYIVGHDDVEYELVPNPGEIEV